jgi:hypothetical protein
MLPYLETALLSQSTITMKRKLARSRWNCSAGCCGSEHGRGRADARMREKRSSCGGIMRRDVLGEAIALEEEGGGFILRDVECK